MRVAFKSWKHSIKFKHDNAHKNSRITYKHMPDLYDTAFYWHLFYIRIVHNKTSNWRFTTNESILRFHTSKYKMCKNVVNVKSVIVWCSTAHNRSTFGPFYNIPLCDTWSTSLVDPNNCSYLCSFNPRNFIFIWL